MRHLLSLLPLVVPLAMGAAASGALANDAPAGDKVGELPVVKNWTAPKHKMLSQALVDETFAKHPELQSLTLQGVPPGYKGTVKSTMFAGTFPERIGKMSSDLDVLVVEKGYTILDPRWNMKDTPPKVTILIPLRDKANQNVGLAVVVFKHPAGATKTEKEYFLAAATIRDELAARIPSHAALFAPAP